VDGSQHVSAPSAPGITSPSGVTNAQLRLPLKPIVVIEPGRPWAGLSLRALWAYRELLFFIAWRDIKIRYKQTLLGITWAILQPFLMMLIFNLFFGRLAEFNAEGLPYPLFAFTGLVPWTFFTNAVSSSSMSLLTNANLITKVYFPRIMLPLAAVLAALLDFALSFVVLLGLMFFYGVTPSLHLLLLPLLVVFTTAFALGIGTWLAALNVKYRDVRFVLPFVMQLWLFISSVILPSTFLPPSGRLLLMLNPMSSLIEGYRSALLNLPFNWWGLISSGVLVLLVMSYSAYVFRRMERTFADII